jgi:hypothetical protein
LTNGGIDRPNLARATLALAVTLARLPFSTLERILMTGFYERCVQVKAPIFIVGYWRSGTNSICTIYSVNRSILAIFRP